MITDTPLVSIIIANWNGRRYLEKCLDSVYLQTYKNIEVIVVDNNSQDDSVDFIMRRFSDVRLVRNNKNHGFAKANNIGIRLSKGEYIATINNDTEAEPEWIRSLVEAIKKDPGIGMCASKVLLFNHRNLIDSAGMLIYPDGLAFCRGHLREEISSHNTEEEVLLPTACAALYRKDAIIDAGFFDDDYFAYGEDIDLGLRIGMLGYRCIYVPSAQVYHYYSGTIGSNLSLKMYLSERNRIFTIIKCYSCVDLLLAFYHTFNRYVHYAYACIKKLGISRDFLKKESVFEIFVIFFKVYASVILGMVKMLKKRHRLGLNRKMKRKSIFSLDPGFRIKAREIVRERRIYINW